MDRPDNLALTLDGRNLLNEVPFVDAALTCGGCRQRFVWSAGEQRYFAKRQFDAPTRCHACRRLAKAPGAEGIPR